MWRRWKIPFIAQMEAVECGAACLAMALHHFGHHAPLSELRAACGVARDGVSAKRLVEVAREYGLRPKARRVEPEHLARYEPPIILHWEMNHFVLLEKWTPRRVYILDPAIGPREVSAEDFDRSFTGVCILLAKDEGFVPRAPQRNPLTRYLELLKDTKLPLFWLALASLMINLLGLTLPIVTQIVVDEVVGQRQPNWLLIVGVAALVAISGLLLSSLLRVRLLALLRRYLDVAIAVGFLEHLLSLPIRFFLQRHTADLVSRVQGVKRVRELLAGDVVALLVDGVLLLSYLALALALDLRLGGLIFLGVLIYSLIYAYASPASLLRFRERLVKEIKGDQQLYQALRGIEAVKGSGKEDAAYSRWMILFVNALNSQLEEVRLQMSASSALTGARLAVPAAVLSVGAGLVIQGELSLGTLLSVQLLQGAVLIPLDRAVRTLLRLRELPVEQARLDDVLQEERERSDGRSAPLLAGDITFERVSFRYGPRAPLVLDDLSFRVRRGEKVALVGSSGCGKSTVGRLLCGFYPPSEGRILIDDQDLADLDLNSVRRQIGVVPQELALFEGTIRDNIALYYPSASRQDVISAARVAQIHEAIEALPLGYDTRITGDGAALSGGQRQRLVLARAILHRPPILLMDEATSALDPITEAAVEQYLASRMCTRIVIAHRLSTVRDADRIFVLDGGTIVEQGRHEDLLARRGLYARLVASSESKERDRDSLDVLYADEVKADDLMAFPALTWLTPEQRESLAKRLTRIELRSDDILVHQGDRSTGAFLVESGHLVQEVSEPGLPPFLLSQVGPGQLIRETSLLSHAGASSSVVAKEPTRVLHLSVASFEEMRDTRDPLYVELLLQLGVVAAARLKANSSRLRELGMVDSLELDHSQHPPLLEAAMSVEQTTLGASMNEEELERLHDLGKTVRLDRGEALFRTGDEGYCAYLLLGGRVALTLPSGALLHTARPGELFGEMGLLGLGARSADGVALEGAVLFSIDYSMLRAKLAAGDSMAIKVLRHLCYRLVRSLRISVLRLREAAALNEGAGERAHHARERARELMRTDDLAMTAAALASEEGRVSLVPATVETPDAVACVAAVMRSYGRAVPISAVHEACTLQRTVSIPSIERGVRAFGMRMRVLRLQEEDLPYLERPLILPLTGGRKVVAERVVGRKLVIMDPRSGRAERPISEIGAELEGSCIEIRPRQRSRATTWQERSLRILDEQRRTLVPVITTSLADQLARLALPAAMAIVIADILPVGDLELLGTVAAGMAALIVFQIFLDFERRWAVNRLRARLDYGLTERLLRHVLRLPMSFFERVGPSEVFDRFIAARLVRRLLNNDVLVALLDLPVAVVALGFMFYLSPSLTALILGLLAVYLISVLLFTRPFLRLNRLATEERAASRDQRKTLIEVLRGIATLRVIGDPEAGMRRWLPAFMKELTVSVRQDEMLMTIAARAASFRNFSLIVILWVGVEQVLAGELDLASLMAFVAVATSYLLVVEGATLHLTSAIRAVAIVRDVGALFEEPPEQRLEEVAAPPRLRGGILLDHVSFSYERDAAPILRDISLRIEPGSKVALVGGSGAGKSTLGKLLLGFYTPSEGAILYDGRDLKGLDLSALRTQLGVVFQETYLFTGSLRQNLTLSAPRATMEEIKEATELADIHEMIEAMPMGYETVVAEGGSTFSGGQRQRLALARAMVHRPSVLLLDEATSALDNLSQAKVEAALARLNCTRIVIAHRLSTVIDADQIVVMDRGRVVETGTHEELLEREGYYARLVRAQGV